MPEIFTGLTIRESHTERKNKIGLFFRFLAGSHCAAAHSRCAVWIEYFFPDVYLGLYLVSVVSFACHFLGESRKRYVMSAPAVLRAQLHEAAAGQLYVKTVVVACLIPA